jgi:hypothetical protein
MRSHPIPHSGEGRIALLRITSLWVTVEACSDGTRAMNANCFCCDASPEVTTSAARTAWASGPPRVRCRPAVSWMPAGRMGCGGPMRPMRQVLPGARLPDEDSYLLWLPPASRDFTP